jgi:hypothetical protein
MLEELKEVDSRLKALNDEARRLAYRRAECLREYEHARSPEARAAYEEVSQALANIHERMKQDLAHMRGLLGLSEEDLEALDTADMPPLDGRYWRREVEGAAATSLFEEGLTEALTALQALVPVDWLKAEAAKHYRLGPDDIALPLHIVAGTRVSPLHVPVSQRFARMLLVTQDFLNGREDFDFLEAPTLLAEVLMLGRHLNLAQQMGPAAARKLASLWEMPEEMVASSVHELLVGVAAIRRGHAVQMLEEDGSKKTPDLRLTDYPIPAVIECKRRLGLTKFEQEEARQVEALYQEVRTRLQSMGAHVAIEVEFTATVQEVPLGDFAQTVEQLTREAEEAWRSQPWGRVRVVRLPYTVDLPTCRFMGPVYLDQVFGWQAPAPDVTAEWDGLLCEVETPAQTLVRRARNPNCLKWRSISPDALTKKARGVTSLFGQAAQQVPTGEVGYIYIAYPEGARPEVADARTRDLLDRVKAREFYHRSGIQIPFVVVGRLYPRPLGPLAKPDFIESCIPIAEDGNEHLLGMLPIPVFTDAPQHGGVQDVPQPSEPPGS